MKCLCQFFIYCSSTPATGLTFGAPATTTIAAQLPAFGAFSSAPLQTSTAPSGLTLNKPAASFGTGLTFGAQPPATVTSTNANAFGITSTTSTTTTTNTKIGLGGIDVNATQPKATEGRTDSAKVKELQLPQEIIATVDALKMHIKQQKTVSSDIVRTSSRKLSNVTYELNKLNFSLAEIHNNFEVNYAAIKQLRAETTKAIQDAEIAQRTHDTIAGLQFENTAPLLYFMEMIQRFESDMLNIRKQLELTENHMRSLTNPQSFTADDLKKGLQQIHECFIALAGRLQETHRLVEAQNEQFLNLMKHREKDKTIVNIYESAGGELIDSNQPMLQRLQTSGSRAIIPNIACGPTPFSSFGINQSVLNKSLLGNSGNFNSNTGWNTSGTNPTSGFTFGAGAGGSGGLFGGSTGDDSYNLQRPPLGTKRNKQ